ncbi:MULTISPECIES: molybdenum cofactor guanylyltransferase [Stenotrophomonas]|uniref:Molybdenum cofactor guanylyltransferase n=1 Tax=Stenotrophomonas maltophilia TaxID=40324 RepID=A0A2J0UC42_STEMA|nr:MULTISPECIES: molybdenum cofactor guanylyltransferase [Stenotrophomonas]PJL28970.1 molybdenum cofactor guanylyltransferase [Stenotrophomonas maltophilia]HDS1146110.1 molybdenum cofactor guanylyltransferase [Stenotrophomonas maltophilia]HDS1162021.1 molybdenum cofactor guanylyltransferase [Stenotrophomonas maltophilia]HEL5401147.1 molybdenum cofactor guanylyltransferase [Stenotrophomonas maltophilia]
MSINGIVLAGGLSSRMGRDKALLPWQGRTLLEYMRGLLKQAGAGAVWVSGDYPAFGGIPDRVARCGPLGGLYSVAMRMPDGPAWVVPVDTPLLSPRLLQQLRDGHRGPCTIFSGHPLPMLVDIDDACRNVLGSMLEDPDGPRSLQALQRRLGVNTMALAPVDEAGLVNCNTPEQWEDVAS